jgi:hypothetical protein
MSGLLQAETLWARKKLYFLPVYKLRRARGSVVVKALRYKSEGPGIDSRQCHWICDTMALGSIQPLVEMSSRNIS